MLQLHFTIGVDSEKNVSYHILMLHLGLFILQLMQNNLLSHALLIIMAEKGFIVRYNK